MRDYHIAIHYRNHPNEVYDQKFKDITIALAHAACAVTYPDDVLYVVVLPC